MSSNFLDHSAPHQRPVAPPMEFPGQGRLIRIIADYSLKFPPQNVHVIDLLDSLGHTAWPPSNIQDIRTFFQVLVSLGKELRVCFRVPDQQIISHVPPVPEPNELVAAFIDFLLLVLQEILSFESDFIDSIEGSIKVLVTELEFLIMSLGDTLMHLKMKETDKVLIEIEALVNEVGSFLYSFVLAIIIFVLVTPDETNKRTMDVEAMVNEVRSFLHSKFSTFLCVTLSGDTMDGMMDIKALANEVGSSLEFFSSTRNDRGILDLALSELLPKFELMKEQIKEHSITFLGMPTHATPKQALASLFIVDSVLDDLLHLINQKPDWIFDMNDQIVTVHHELNLLRSSIGDIVMQQQVKHEELVTRIIDVAFEVEYVVNSFPPVWYLTLRLPQLIEKIKFIRIALREMNCIDAERAPEVAKYTGEPVSFQHKERAFSEDLIVGLENERIKIAEQLIGAPDKLQIISICGMPGLGKTTLANKLYNDPSIVYHFDERAWCVVSQTYNTRHMLIGILRSISHLKRETIMNMDDENLSEYLYKSLKGRRYLIVMDDIWNVDAWNILERFFPDDRIGSRILLTTRHKEVGLQASPHAILNALPFLSKVECWELLQRKVFPKESCPQELLKIGKKIARNCQGLPLAVVLIASVLANMEKTEHLWAKVAQNLSLHISETSQKFMPTLELSYKHLPIYLKPCFLYFGSFKEDREIPVRKLLWLWIAEGFIKKQEQKTLEDVSQEYLMELIDRNLVHVGKRRFDGEVKTCRIHDLLCEMCLRIAAEHDFLKEIKNEEVSIYQRYHRLSIYEEARPTYSLPFGLHVRSLLYTSFVLPDLVSHSINVLRVLDVLNKNSKFDDLKGIAHLVHLRYLAVPKQLPPTASLHKLEFLILNNVCEVEIPEILLNMVNLRLVHFLGGAFFSASSRQRADKGESFQVNKLQSISLLSISHEMDVKLLRCSHNLCRLKGRIKSSLLPSFNLFHQLESLNISISVRFRKDSSFSLPTNLKKLTLDIYYLSLKQMEIIGRLMNLEVLKLKTATFEGEKWDTSEGQFLQLKFLKLSGLRITEWNSSSDHFPSLRRLALQRCYNLEKIPCSLGDIPTLQIIQIHNCALAIKESALQIKEEQDDIGNEELKVIISDS